MIQPPVPHYVLAGGKSRRFGSDKARHVVDASPMLVRVRDAFASIASHTYAVARQADAYADLGVDTIGDLVPDRGPLGGLMTALTHHARQPVDRVTGKIKPEPTWVLVTSCDLADPFRLDVTSLMNQARDDTRASVFRNDEFFEPFPGFYRSDLLSDIEGSIERRDRSMQHLLRQLGTLTVARPMNNPGQRVLDLDRPGEAAG
ncbi:MAG: molybdenum cofactor guanylyltransferase [Planctomycetota bacterium]